ncbi:DsbA family protein [Myxococcus sp. K15C18031901]|uniref:DsbA family protein n=1 Tax=Myxococcus dinghuensis TaxID=2906761 RepID=UPI0020A7096B|nr:DsbA family protein [Myxococcus dinghuensis]MCP3098886.1 DsbA family protein [Myxococcus dinghuensis]
MKPLRSAHVAAGLLLLSSSAALAAEPTGDPTCPKPPERKFIAATPRAEAPTLGPRDARVTVEVWSDFQCPFCARGATLLTSLRERYGDQVRIVFRHQPLPAHRDARLAAAASMAASEQGRFWQMHDLLFASPGALDRASLEKHARTLGLDLPRFRRALDTGAWDAYVEADVVEAQRRGVVGTPVFFVNGAAVMGAQPLETFTQLIDAELAR